MSDYRQQQETEEKLACALRVIDRVRAGITTIDDAEFLEVELAIPQSLRVNNYGEE